MSDAQVEVSRGPRRQVRAGQVEFWEWMSSRKVEEVRGEGD